MDLLSYDFCLSVCSTLADSTNLKTLCSEDPTDELWVWKAAVDKADKKRSHFGIWLNVRDDRWSYSIYGNGKKYSFHEFKMLDKDGVQLVKITLSNTKRPENWDIKSSFEEVKEILAYFRPFENMFRLVFWQNRTISDEIVVYFMSFYQNSSIAGITDIDEYGCKDRQSTEDFLLLQLQTNSFLRSIRCNRVLSSEELRREVEEFAFREESVDVMFSHTNMHNKAFFDRLIRKPLTRNRFVYYCMFSFDYSDLLAEGFQAITEENVWRGRNPIRWIREDGVVVSVSLRGCGIAFWVELTKDISLVTWKW